MGGKLPGTALDDVRRRGLRMVIDCPFISSWVKRHREYDDLIDRTA